MKSFKWPLFSDSEYNNKELFPVAGSWRGSASVELVEHEKLSPSGYRHTRMSERTSLFCLAAWCRSRTSVFQSTGSACGTRSQQDADQHPRNRLDTTRVNESWFDMGVFFPPNYNSLELTWPLIKCESRLQRQEPILVFKALANRDGTLSVALGVLVLW